MVVRHGLRPSRGGTLESCHRSSKNAPSNSFTISKNTEGGAILEETEEQLEKRDQPDLERLDFEEKQRRVVGKIGEMSDVYRRCTTGIYFDERSGQR